MNVRGFPSTTIITIYFFTIVIYVAFIFYTQYLLYWNFIEFGKYMLFGSLSLIMILPIFIKKIFPATIITIYFSNTVLFIASIFYAQYFLYWNIFEVGEYLLFGTLVWIMILPIIVKKLFSDISQFLKPFRASFLFSCFISIIVFLLFFYEIFELKYFAILSLLVLCLTPFLLPIFITNYQNTKSIFSVAIGYILSAIVIGGCATLFVFSSLPAVRY